MKNWTVYENDKCFYIKDLKNEFDGRDRMLLTVYLEGDCDNPYNNELMWGALYDLAQICDGITMTDTFETPFGNFYCEGVHVLRAEV